MTNPFTDASHDRPILAEFVRDYGTRLGGLGGPAFNKGDKVYAYYTCEDLTTIYPADDPAGASSRNTAGAVPVTALRAIVEPEKDARRFEWNEAALRLAQKFERTATFSYEKKKGPGGVIEIRSVRPDIVYTARDGVLLVVGEDGDRQDVRAFRLDRIIGYVTIAGGKR